MEVPTEDPHNVEYWNNRWVENKIGFHKSQVNPTLLKYMELMTGQKLSEEPLADPEKFQQNSNKTWFVPLCGKSLDIPYLLSQGFRVFGIEGVKMAIEALDSEHSLGMTYNEETSLFTGANGLLQIYVGDLFGCPVEKFGPFDYIWDRGSFIALEYPFRQKYSDVMQRALKNSDGSWHNFNYLLETLMYDKSVFGGPPRSVDDDDMQKFYATWANFNLLSSGALAEGSSAYKALNGEGSTRIYHVTPV